MKHTLLLFFSILLFFAPISAVAASVTNVDCLASAIYYEARGESRLGQIYVGDVIVNRIQDGFAKSACTVVQEHHGNHYQFGFKKDHHPVIHFRHTSHFYILSEEILNGRFRFLPRKVLYFNNRPFPRRKYRLWRKVGHQYFYEKRIR